MQNRKHQTNSQRTYSISPDLLRELEALSESLERRILDGTSSPDYEAWHKRRGFEKCLNFIKMAVFGTDFNSPEKREELLDYIAPLSGIENEITETD